jgi:streptogramin lyase
VEVAMRAATARGLAALTAALVGLPAAACGTSPGPPPAAAAPTSGSTEADDLPVLRDITESGAATIAASPNPDWAVAAAGGFWIAGVGPGLQRYDATTGAGTAEVEIYSVCSAMDEDFGSIWAMSCDYGSPKLVRIDTATAASVAEMPMPARLPAAVWLLTSGSPRQLLAIDPGTNTVARTLPAPDGAKAVRAGLGAVWVSVVAPGQVVRFDPASGEVTATIEVGQGASFLAVGPDAVWVINASNGTVSRLDPPRTR